MKMNLMILNGIYAIYKFKAVTALPSWIRSSDFYSITETRDELSVVAIQNDLVIKDVLINRDWRIIKIEGPLDFSLVGIIADISAVFKKQQIPIFAISTYDTDYVLVKQNYLNAGIQALIESGYIVSPENKKAPY
jgi:uncharacterized protein